MNKINLITRSYETLRRSALNSPFEDKSHLSMNEIIEHFKAFDYDNNYISVIVAVTFFKEKRFFWYLETFLESKKSKKRIAVNLMTAKQIAHLRQLLKQALGDSGNGEITTRHKADAYVWEVPFATEDYEKLNPKFRELIKPDTV